MNGQPWYKSHLPTYIHTYIQLYILIYIGIWKNKTKIHWLIDPRIYTISILKWLNKTMVGCQKIYNNNNKKNYWLGVAVTVSDLVAIKGFFFNILHHFFRLKRIRKDGFFFCFFPLKEYWSKEYYSMTWKILILCVVSTPHPEKKKWRQMSDSK